MLKFLICLNRLELNKISDIELLDDYVVLAVYNIVRDLAVPELRTKDRIKWIREKIRRNPQRSARKLAAEENVNRESMRQLLKYDLGFRTYRKRKLRGLMDDQKDARVNKTPVVVEAARSTVSEKDKLFRQKVTHYGAKP